MEEQHQALKSELAALPAVPRPALQAFVAEETALVRQVDENLRLDMRFRGAGDTAHAEISTDFQTHFARLLHSIYQFELYPVLADELDWYVTTLAARGFNRDYFRRMLDAWNMALLTGLNPAEGKSLAPLPALVARRLDEFFPARAPESPALDDDGRQFLALLRDRESQETAEFVARRIGGETWPGLIARVVMPVLETIGVLWQRDELSAADEHAATAICRDAVVQALAARPHAEARRGMAVIGCVPGEEHDFGARIAAAALENSGWTVTFLGRSAPEPDIVRTVERIKPRVAVLSVVLVENLPAAMALLEALGRTCPDTRRAIGGRAALLARSALTRVSEAIIPDLAQVSAIVAQMAEAHA